VDRRKSAILIGLGVCALSFLSCKNTVAPGAPDHISQTYTPRPNLVIESLTGRLSFTTANFVIVVKNIGNGPSLPSRLRIEFRGTDYDAPMYWLIDQRDLPVPSLPRDASCPLTYVQAGHYFRGIDYVYSLTVTVDPYQEIAESDESDNTGGIMKRVFGALRYAPSSSGAPLDTNLTIGFSDPVVIGSGSIVIRRASDGSVFETIDVASGQVTVSGTIVTIDPNGLFEPQTGYIVEYADTCFDDDEGDSYDAGSWSFGTG